MRVRANVQIAKIIVEKLLDGCPWYTTQPHVSDTFKNVYNASPSSVVISAWKIIYECSVWRVVLGGGGGKDYYYRSIDGIFKKKSKNTCFYFNLWKHPDVLTSKSTSFFVFQTVTTILCNGFLYSADFCWKYWCYQSLWFTLVHLQKAPKL